MPRPQPAPTVQIFWIKLDPQQYLTLLTEIHDLKAMIAALSTSIPGGDPGKIQAITDKLKHSADALKAAVEANSVAAAHAAQPTTDKQGE